MILPTGIVPLVLFTWLFQQQQQQHQHQSDNNNNKTSRTITMVNRLSWLPSSISNSRLDKDVINASASAGVGEDDDDNDNDDDDGEKNSLINNSKKKDLEFDNDPFSTVTIIDEKNYIDSDDNENDNISDSNVSTVTHIIVLIHGWMGNALEMDYIRESIKNAAVTAATNKNENNKINDRDNKNKNDDKRHHRFVIHSALCNEDRTNDGIVAGGERIANEINSLVRYIVNGGSGGSSSSSSSNKNENDSNSSSKTHSDPVTLSIIGNSLGGLYARQALAGIDWNMEHEKPTSSLSASPSSSSSSPSITLRPMVFLTTATPHLGISGHTYVPLPRAAEFMVAQSMQETGKDFFRFNTVVEDLSYKQYYIQPLSRFQQRICYVNVYGTDFQVPTATAAFWAPGSDSPHYRVVRTSTKASTDANEEDDDVPTPKEIVMTLTTPRRLDNILKNENNKEEILDLDQNDDILSEKNENKNRKKSHNDHNDPSEVYKVWSKRLDRLGWTKVLVDVRETVPSVPVAGSPTPSEASIHSSTRSIEIENEKANDDGERSDDDNSVGGDNSDNNSGGNNSIINSSSKDDDDDKSNNSNSNNNNNEGGKNNDVNTDRTDTDTYVKDNWTAGELLTEFKGGLMTASGKASGTKSFWSLVPRIPVRWLLWKC
jgi:hypothetical protein